VHSVDRAIIVAPWEKLFTLDGTGHNIADEWIFFGKICGEVHLLPLESLPNSQSWESKIGSNSLSFHKIQKAICEGEVNLSQVLTLRIDVNGLGMGLLIILLNPKDIAIMVLVLEDVSVLLSLEPGIL